MKILFPKVSQLFIVLFGMSVTLWQCTSTKPLDFTGVKPINAQVVKTGLLNCYQNGMKADSINYIYAETSAAMKIGDQILIAIDKPVPATVSPVFTVPVADVLGNPKYGNSLNYVMSKPFQKVLKIEAFAKSPSDSLFFATTAFDRIRGSSADWDGYNALLTWQAKDLSDVEYVAGTDRDNVTSSRDLRFSIQKALTTKQFPNGAPYFKIEALAILPGNRLIFGVREIGESYQKFDYSFTLLETTFTNNRMGIQVDPSFKKVYEFQPIVNGHQMGISDLVYHAATNSLLALTTFEDGTDEKTKTFASSLWVLPLSRLEKGEAPLPVMNDGKQFELSYKAEGFTFLDDRTLFVICDEDRKDSIVKIGKEMITKQPHQTIYFILKL